MIEHRSMCIIVRIITREIYDKLGYSKDRRPDLLQFKQGLAVLEPAGVPVYSNTFAGNDANDPNIYLLGEEWQKQSDIRIFFM